MNLTPYFKSIIDQDVASVVICNLKHEIIYMNPKAVESYHKWGGEALLGKSLMNCHNPKSKHIGIHAAFPVRAAGRAGDGRNLDAHHAIAVVVGVHAHGDDVGAVFRLVRGGATAQRKQQRRGQQRERYKLWQAC